MVEGSALMRRGTLWRGLTLVGRHPVAGQRCLIRRLGFHRIWHAPWLLWTLICVYRNLLPQM